MAEEAAASEDSGVPHRSRTTVRRLPQRGSNERAVVDSILDEALVCHVGFSTPEGPVVLPTLFVRAADEIALHGAPANAMLRSSAGGGSICCTVTLVDALVMARSAFHHSVNYRSAVVFGRCREVTDPDEKLALMTALVDKVVPGRASEAREPNAKELRATQVVVMTIDDASAKIRTGPPADDEEDYELPVWAGELPLAAAPGRPVPDERLVRGVRAPRFVDGRWRAIV
jgi:nitroimidazol reductase NimA-like FMN-containing flavoprotein (pyridoxamine 5'-phosphate oxidase superfamily)